MRWLLVILLLMMGNRTFASPVDVMIHDIEGMNTVLQIEVDSANRKWVRARSGLYMYDGNYWTIFDMGSDLPPNVFDVFIDSEGQVWLATNAGIAKWNEGDWLIYNRENTGMPVEEVQQVYIAADGVWWVSTFKELYRYDGREWTLIETFSDISVTFTEMIVAEDNSIWMLSSSPSLWCKKSIGYPLSRAYISDNKDNGNDASFLVETDSGTLRIGHGMDVWEYKIQSGDWRLISRNPSLNPSTRSSNMVLDGDDGFRWYFAETIIYSRGEDWSELMLPDDIHNTGNYFDAVIDHDNALWVLGRNGIMSLDPQCLFICSPHENPWDWRTDEYWEHWYPGEDISITWIARDVEPLTLSWSKDGVSWIILADSIDPGSNRYDWRIPDKLIPHGEYTSQLKLMLSSVDGLSDTTMITVERPGFAEAFTTQPVGIYGISDACQTPDGCLWFATNRLLKYDDVKWTEFEISENINQIESTPDGDIWLSTSNGIRRFDGETWEQWFDGSTLDDKMVVTATGEVWLSRIEYLPDGQGWYRSYQRLYQYHHEEWIEMGAQLGMSDFFIKLLVSDPGGELWIYGYRLSETPEASTEECLVYDSASGELEMFPVDMSPSELFWDNQGAMWRLERSDSFHDDILYKYSNGIWMQFPVNPVLKSRYEHEMRLYFIHTDSNNRLWFNSNSGILSFDGESWMRHFYTTETEFRLAFIDRDNNKWLANGNYLICFSEASVPVESTPALSPFTLDAPYPNPFNLSVTIPFSLPEAARMEVAIYSITGQRMRELSADRLPAGSHTLIWDGRDNAGAVVSSGLYIVRVAGGGYIAARKVVLVK